MKVVKRKVIRPSLDFVMLVIASTLAHRATCCKMQVGCVLTNKRGHIIGTGYNGVAAGCEHCTDVPCPGANTPAGSDLCEAIHAEQNALMQCRNVFEIEKAYISYAPCMRCTKQLLNTSCTTIIFNQAGPLQLQAQALWTKAGRTWIQQ